MIKVWLAVMIFTILFVLFVTPRVTNEGSEKTVNYTVDPTQIVGDTAEQRLESFRDLLNKKTEGFSIISLNFNAKEKELSYNLMVYSKEKVLTISSENIIFSDNLDNVLRQVFVSSIKNARDDLSFVAVIIHDSNMNIVGVGMGMSGMKKLQKLPPQRWKESLGPAAVFDVVPMTLVPVGSGTVN